MAAQHNAVDVQDIHKQAEARSPESPVLIPSILGLGHTDHTTE